MTVSYDDVHCRRTVKGETWHLKRILSADGSSAPWTSLSIEYPVICETSEAEEVRHDVGGSGLEVDKLNLCFTVTVGTEREDIVGFVVY